MTHQIDETEAGHALQAVQRGRREVLAEINVPVWYWLALAAGWIGLGALAQFGPAWASGLATIAFGAGHATVGSRVLSGRHGSHRLSVRQEMVTWRVPAYIIAFLVAMVAATLAIALALNADGARDPALLAGIAVAGLVLSLGPNLMALVRRREQRRPLG